MSLGHGKKVGKLVVKLDRKKTRHKWASVEVELRFDIYSGAFWAQYENNWFSDPTKDGLSEKIKVAATKALSLEWRRYIQIDYEARGWPIEDEASGRPAHDGTYHDFTIEDDRSKFGRGRDEDEPFAICGINLHWTLCEISEPYTLPEDPNKRVRAKRDVDVVKYGSDVGKQRIGEPQEWDDDKLPPGTLLWTPEREALLAEVVVALGKLDGRLVELFSGDAEVLAKRIDAAAQTDPSRLLAAPTKSKTAAVPKKRRS